MVRTSITEGQALWQPGGAEEDSHFRDGDRHHRLAYGDDEEEFAPAPAHLGKGRTLNTDSQLTITWAAVTHLSQVN